MSDMELWLKKVLFGGKNGQFPYWIKSYWNYFTPLFNRQARLEAIIAEAKARPDYGYILKRVDFYNKMSEKRPLPINAHTIGVYRLDKEVRRILKSKDNEALAKTYFFDSYDIWRWFDGNLKAGHFFGDNREVLPYPMITKTRPICDDNTNNVLLNLDKNRHFVFLNDTTPFDQKENRMICRCCINWQPQRIALFEKYFGADWCDMGFVGNNPNNTYPEQWRGNKISLYDHLRYKFISCLEGFDVASNLKWVMSSNSIAVTTKPVVESWFMESQLIPDYHFICIKDDLSDLKEKLYYYIAHPELCLQIVKHANEYVAQFRDAKREQAIAILVMEKYFRMTEQI